MGNVVGDGEIHLPVQDGPDFGADEFEVSADW
jgi:hypothetical protein